MFWSPSKPKVGSIPKGLEDLLPNLSDAQQKLAKKLCVELCQDHLFVGTPEEQKALLEQLEKLNASYPSGLEGYVTNARDLLEKSRKGVNPLMGWKPSVPIGMSFELGSKEYSEMEELGRKELGKVGFVLVAGGLGERLGYGGIKVGLPTDLATNTCYLNYYIDYILAIEERYANGVKLPLCIMTSADTNAGTVKLLEENDYFGFPREQLTIVQQGDGVPALQDNDARIALSDPPSAVQTKPHGHGDIHALLYQNKVAEKWVAAGVEWISFFQDTNGLAFHTLPLCLGVSVKKDLVMNSLAIPRKAKQAVGAIAKLTNSKSGATRTINVEYNQLDPLLRSTGSPNGDANDPKTGLSPFPGNINQLLFSAAPYLKALNDCKGSMPEFVNPKYKDAAKTIFKKPTRLECMMQDFPAVYKGPAAKKVGFTSISADMCFSPVKNATADGVTLQGKGTHPACAASGEADQYGACRKIMRAIGVDINDAEPEEWKGVSVVLGPAVSISPDTMCCLGEYKEVFPTPEKVHISPNSSLVIKGSGRLVIESLTLDGALVIECQEGANAVVKDVTVKNKGWNRVAVKNSRDEVLAMRGYRLVKEETEEFTYTKDACVVQ